MDLRWKLRKLLGGAVDDGGRPTADPDGWEDLGTARAEDADRFLVALAGRGIEGRRQHLRPERSDGPDDEVLVQVRHRNAAHVRRLVHDGDLPVLAHRTR